MTRRRSVLASMKTHVKEATRLTTRCAKMATNGHCAPCAGYAMSSRSASLVCDECSSARIVRFMVFGAFAFVLLLCYNCHINTSWKKLNERTPKAANSIVRSRHFKVLFVLQQRKACRSCIRKFDSLRSETSGSNIGATSTLRPSGRTVASCHGPTFFDWLASFPVVLLVFAPYDYALLSQSNSG